MGDAHQASSPILHTERDQAMDSQRTHVSSPEFKGNRISQVKTAKKDGKWVVYHEVWPFSRMLNPNQKTLSLKLMYCSLLF